MDISLDPLARGLTKETKVFGVAITTFTVNVVSFFFLSFISAVLTQGLIAPLCFISIGVGAHFLISFVNRKDDKALIVELSRPKSLEWSKDGLNQYSPNIRAKDAVISILEKTAKRFIPYQILLDDKTVLTKSGQCLQIFKIDGFAFKTKDDVDIEIQKGIRSRFINQVADENIAIYIHLVKNKTNTYPAGTQQNSFSETLNQKYKEHIKSKQFYNHQYYVTVIHKAPKEAQNQATMDIMKSWFKGKDNCVDSAKFSNVIDKLNDISLRITTLFEKENVRALKVHDSGRFEESEQLTFLSELIHFESRKVRPPIQSIDDYILYKEHAFAKNKGVMQIKAADGSSRYGAMLSLKEYPKYTHAGMFDALLNIKSELILCQSFEFVSKKKQTSLLVKGRKQMEKAEDSVKLIEDIEIAEEEAKSGDLTYGHHSVSICVIADSLKELDKNVHAIDAALNEKVGLICTKETRGIELAFWSMLPGNMRFSLRKGFINDLNLAGFASQHNHPKGKLTGNRWGDAITMLETVDGTPFAFNFHVNQVANTFLLGKMGSGKTAQMSFFMSQMSKFGGWRFIFDKDNGMEPIVRMMGGSYEKLMPGLPSGMAPLQLENTAQNIAFNKELLKKILSIYGALTPSEIMTIEKAVEGIYSLEVSKRTFKNLAPFFGTSRDGSLRQKFDRWHSDGSNAWVFDNDIDNFSINSKVYGLDIGNILKDEYQEIRVPIFMYLFNRIGELLDSSPTAVFVPEGWQVFQDSIFKAQIKDWSKTPRKNNMALIIDTQAPDDLASSVEGVSLLRESVTQIYFADESATYDDYAKFNLTQKEFDIIKYELPRLSHEHYFLLKQGRESVIVKADLSACLDELTVLSGSLDKALLLKEIIPVVGKEPTNLLPAFLNEYKSLTQAYGGDFQLWKNQFGAKS